jgi:hypothetical protein
LTNEGIEYLRDYLNLPREIVPATLKKTRAPVGTRPRGFGDRGDRGERNRDNGPSSAAAPAAANGVPSFEDAFEAELVSELGDLGPGAVEAEGRSSSGGDRRPPRGRSRRR